MSSHRSTEYLLIGEHYNDSSLKSVKFFYRIHFQLIPQTFANYLCQLKKITFQRLFVEGRYFLFHISYFFTFIFSTTLDINKIKINDMTHSTSYPLTWHSSFFCMSEAGGGVRGIPFDCISFIIIFIWTNIFLYICQWNLLMDTRVAIK